MQPQPQQPSQETPLLLSPSISTSELPAHLQSPSGSPPQGSEVAGSPSLMAGESTIAVRGQEIQATMELEPEEIILDRLVGVQARVNNNTPGQIRYFGPTSSLHFTESVTSIFSYCNEVSRSVSNFEKDIPWAMQQYLLDLYWRYQHNALHIIHKAAFLAGMETGQSPYFSHCLLLCVLASAARCSVSPEIRALSVSGDNTSSAEKPILTKQAENALEKELLNPGLTTIQSLMLLSILDCCQSNDLRGWMRSGNSPVGIDTSMANMLRTCLPASL